MSRKSRSHLSTVLLGYQDNLEEMELHVKCVLRNVFAVEIAQDGDYELEMKRLLEKTVLYAKIWLKIRIMKKYSLRMSFG